MAKWTKNKATPEQINNGNEYTTNDNLSVEAINGIVNNSFKAQEDAERALELATGANEANGTVVKINGEPQGTWDATFAEELRNESANLFKAELLNGVKGIVVKDNGKTIEMPITNSGVGDVNTGLKLSELCPDMEVGKTYFLSFTRSFNDGSNYIYLAGSSSFWSNNTSKKITQQELDGNVSIYSNRFSSGFTEQMIISDFAIVKGTLPMSEWSGYNPNHHITNSEAEFFKEEFGKQKNLAKIDNSSATMGVTLSYSNETNKLSIKGTSAGEYTFTLLNKVKYEQPYVGYHTLKAENAVFLKAGTYTISCNKAINKGLVWVAYGKTLGVKLADSSITKETVDNKLTINLQEDSYLMMFFYLNSTETFDSYISNIQIEKGSVATPYQPYNSASHITNPQADLLKSEWEKQVNLLNLLDLKSKSPNNQTSTITNGEIIGVSTGTYSHLVYYIENLEVGKTYTLSFDAISVHSTGSPRVLIGNNLTTGDNTYRGFDIATTKTHYTRTFIATSNILAFTVYINTTYYDEGNGITMSNIILNDGGVELPYQPYNGQIIHKKDIEPIKVWENGNINAGFAPQDIITSEGLYDAKWIIVVYESYQYQTSMPECKILKMNQPGVNSLFFLSGTRIESDTNILITRQMKISNSTTITVSDAYRENTKNNAFLIPIAIYKIM